MKLIQVCGLASILFLSSCEAAIPLATKLVGDVLTDQVEKLTSGSESKSEESSTATPTDAPAPPAPTPPPNDNAPIIQSANANPRVIASSSDVITFTINAHSPINSPMEFTWTATKGFMSATKGESVQWYPIGADAKPQPGPAVITCIITDTQKNQKKIDFNLLILPDGGAQLEGQSES